ncbi:MAG: CoA transferase [Chloroflexi bacterium]|nr:CoA transferase [Chloroflexota bacterium]
MEKALSHLRVLDLSEQIAGPFCTKLLGDLGADVVKIEAPPEGDRGRRLQPFAHDTPDPHGSLVFLYLNTNKRSVTLNLRTPEGIKVLTELLATADALVESFAPGTLAALGLDDEALEQINPGLVLTSITPFGQTGPYSHWKATELVEYAMSGVMAISGTQGREPLKHGLSQAQYCGGFGGAIATLAALWFREETGEGQHVDVSIQECLASTLLGNSTQYSYAGVVGGQSPSEGSSIGQVAPCKDGYIVGHMLQQRRREFIELFGVPELASPEFVNRRGRGGSQGKEMDALLLPRYAQWNKFDLFNAANQRGLIFGVVQTPKDLAECPQLQSRGFFVPVEHPTLGTVRHPGSTFEMSETPWSLDRPAPLLGQHNDEIFCEELGYSKREVARLRKQGVL